MGECDGVWDLIMGMFAKSDYEFYALKNELLSEFRGLVVKSYGDVMVDTKQYPKMYFTGELAEPTEFAGLMVENQLDALDHSILGEMVNNARMPLTSIAAKVGSTPATVSARLKRMEKLGIIIQYRISVDMDKLGVEMYKAIIHLERYTKKDEKEVLSFFSSIPNTQYLIRNMWNVEPELVVSNYHEYHALMDKAKQRFPHVIRNVESVLFRSDEWTPGYKNLLGLTRKEKKETG